MVPFSNGAQVSLDEREKGDGAADKRRHRYAYECTNDQSHRWCISKGRVEPAQGGRRKNDYDGDEAVEKRQRVEKKAIQLGPHQLPYLTLVTVWWELP